ncbi:MAG: 30S ribosomal protein S9 [Bacteroidetes bacterium]|nr:30S ribosomal protein S9 [Bacteroidota bacterium]MBS1618287.1 30S ribosomal protein S9 [Bacteroidota bacterium]
MSKDKITVGRRKAAVARVVLRSGNGTITVNGKDYKDYFPLDFIQQKVEAPLKTADAWGKFDVTVNVFGGGVKGQAEAIVLGIARALVNDNPEVRPALKKEKFMRRDAREVERKKTGLRKARRQEQFSKR